VIVQRGRAKLRRIKPRSVKDDGAKAFISGRPQVICIREELSTTNCKEKQ